MVELETLYMKVKDFGQETDELDVLWHHIFTSAASSGLWLVSMVAVPWVLGD